MNSQNKNISTEIEESHTYKLHSRHGTEFRLSDTHRRAENSSFANKLTWIGEIKISKDEIFPLLLKNQISSSNSSLLIDSEKEQFAEDNILKTNKK